jgi:DNA-binding NarL/FixJ family response regulator
MKKDKIDILIVDDNEFYRKGLILMLKRISNIGKIQEANNGLEFLDLINKKDPDLVFMDIKMPEMDGVIATKKAVQINHNLKIIALTMHKDEVHFTEMILAGAKGFLLKDADEDEFITAINTVLKGGSYYSIKAVNGFK